MRLHELTRTFRIALLLAIVTIACGGSGRGPDRTVRRLIAALNDRDVHRVLACIDPREERMLNASFRLVEKATGIPLNDIFELVPAIHQLRGGGLHDDVRFTRVRILRRTITGNTAHLVVGLTSMSRAGGAESTHDQQVDFVLENFEDGGWRVVGVGGL